MLTISLYTSQSSSFFPKVSTLFFLVPWAKAVRIFMRWCDAAVLRLVISERRWRRAALRSSSLCRCWRRPSSQASIASLSSVFSGMLRLSSCPRETICYGSLSKNRWNEGHLHQTCLSSSSSADCPWPWACVWPPSQLLPLHHAGKQRSSHMKPNTLRLGKWIL